MNTSKLCKFIGLFVEWRQRIYFHKFQKEPRKYSKKIRPLNKLLLEQIQMFEGLLEDKSGKEVAYRRVHYINNLIRDIEDYTKTPYNKDFDQIIVELPQGI